MISVWKFKNLEVLFLIGIFFYFKNCAFQEIWGEFINVKREYDVHWDSCFACINHQHLFLEEKKTFENKSYAPFDRISDSFDRILYQKIK